MENTISGNGNWQSHFNNLPHRLKSKYLQNEVNECIILFKGNVTIKAGASLSNVEGFVQIEWLPSPNVTLEITKFNKINTIDWQLYFLNDKTLDIYFEGIKIGAAIVKEIAPKKKHLLKLLFFNCIAGDINLPTSKVTFSLPNLKSFHGIALRNRNDKFSVSMSRLIFENSHHKIILDKREKHKEVEQECKDINGYIIMYDGEIELKREFDYTYICDLVWKFGIFLSFLNGQRTSPFLIEGFKDGQRTFFDFKEPYVDSYKIIPSWPSAHTIFGLEALWNKFYTSCKDDDEFDVIKTIVHLYIDSNRNASLESGLILNQSIIELIYNFYVAERNINENEIEKAYQKKALSKLKKLFSQSKYKHKILNGFPELENYLNKNGLYHLTFYVQVRNALVHSKKASRNFYNSIPITVRKQLYEFGLLFLEIVFLEILDYKGKIKNRKSGGWIGEHEI